MKRLLAILLALTMLFIAGCGAKSMESNGSSMDRVDSSVSESGKGELVESPENALTQGQKLVRKLWLTAETENLDTLLGSVEQKVRTLGGYMEAREIHNYSVYNRRAELTIRVPADSLDQFAEVVKENANVTSTTETADNITLSYVAVESRMKALETEQTRLLELLSKAENMTEILQIEERLTKVRTELEEVTSQLRVYDNQVDYGTIYLTLHEVREYTEEDPEGFWARVGNGLTESIESIGDGVVEILIWLIVASPYLALLALTVGAVVLIVKRRKKKAVRKEKKEE